MGCCNKVHEDKPISRTRYVAGVCLFAGVQGAVLAGLAAGSLVSARCRNVRSFHRAWAADRWRSIRAHEGFRVGGKAAGGGTGACEDPACPRREGG
jgi:hypothetical protein